MVSAEFIKSVDVHLPDGELGHLEIYRDPRTGRLFGVDSAHVEQSDELVIHSPFSEHMKLKIQ